MNASAAERMSEARWHLRWSAFAFLLFLAFGGWGYGDATDPSTRAFSVLPSTIAFFALITVISEIRAAIRCRRHANLLK